MMTAPVWWAELKPDEFRERLDACPVVYLPLGLCEPHGHIAAFGLDTIKAEHLCQEAARRFGGIVAPTQGYHIHESGYHAAWLEQVVGEENPRMTALPPYLMGLLLLYQLRAFVNAGFRAAMILTGHAGGNETDLRRVSGAFARASGMRILLQTDVECLEGRYQGDHAGRYEISQLLYLRPDLVDLTLLHRRHEENSGGRLALGDDAGEATAAFGKEVLSAALEGLGRCLGELTSEIDGTQPLAPLDYDAVEGIWRTVRADIPSWTTMNPAETQASVSPCSRWKPYEHPRPPDNWQ